MLLAAAILGFLYLTDPDGGLSTLGLVMNIAVVVLAILAAHWFRKAIFHSPEADVDKLIQKANDTPAGAGLALIAISIVLSTIIFCIAGKVHAETLPPNAVTYIPVLKSEQMKYWGDHTKPELLASLVEQESCVSLKSKKCWSPASQLKTDREEGAGVGQITRAYTKSGAIRFDALTDLRNRHPQELQGWSWDNVYSNPAYQFRALVLMSKDNYKQIAKYVTDPTQALSFTDAAYNGGFGGVQSDRRKCQMTAGCNPQMWFGNVEKTCSKSQTPIYGTRSACDINREHVTNVVMVRAPKYVKYMNS
jgi:hypothetical protein